VGLTRLPLPPRNGGDISGIALDAMTKGMPASAGRVLLSEVGQRGWNLFRGDLPLPAAVLRIDRLAQNDAWMRAFLQANGLLIAPHGKTTMAPQLYAMQHLGGAWAITVATTQQLAVASHFGFPRVILANQPTGPASIDACFAALREHGFELHVLADSRDGVAALAAGAARAGLPGKPLGVLVEMGVAGGRTGTRTRSDALAVARIVASTPGLALTGIECFEGILPDVAAVDAMLEDVLAVARDAVSAGLFGSHRDIILSAGGSAFFDRVGERFGTVDFAGHTVRKIIRSGCYLTHDAIGYEHAHERILRETRLTLPPGRLEPALEVWTYVQSRPEPGKAILTAGKRDISHDSALPLPVSWFRPGQMDGPEKMPEGHEITGLNDQHAHLALPADSPLAVGDMVALGIAHPCTTFDKWDVLMVIDARGNVCDAVKTYF
jgi:D-serine dehydratase